MVDNDFAGKLIKGRIAETVFELMFREENKYEVFPLGYEHITPVLRQFRDHPNQEHREIINKVLDNYDSSPDFLLTNKEKSEVYLIEVKFRNWPELYKDESLEIAKEIHERWNPAHLFLATSNKFYYDSCNRIIEKQGHMDPLQDRIIKSEIQNYYLQLLNRFEK